MQKILDNTPYNAEISNSRQQDVKRLIPNLQPESLNVSPMIRSSQKQKRKRNQNGMSMGTSQSITPSPMTNINPGKLN